MGRKKVPADKRAVRLSVSVPPEQAQYVDKRLQELEEKRRRLGLPGKVDRSKAVQSIIAEVMGEARS